MCDLSWKKVDFGWAQVLAIGLLALAHGFKSQSGVNSFPSFLGTKIPLSLGLPGGSVLKNPPADTGDVSLIPGSGRPTGGGNGNPLQFLPWKIAWTEQPDGLQSRGSQRVRHHSFLMNIPFMQDIKLKVQNLWTI